MKKGSRQNVCCRGHQNPPRNARGQCKTCCYEYNKERRRREVFGFNESIEFVNALRWGVYRLPELPEEPEFRGRAR